MAVVVVFYFWLGVHRRCCVSCCTRRVWAEFVLVSCSGSNWGDGDVNIATMARRQQAPGGTVRSAVCGHASMKLD